jgi:hypothetical protein
MMKTPEDQLNESEVTSRLFEIINNMSELERIKLLDKLEEWQPFDNRKHPRRDYVMPADYIIQGNTNKGLVKDVSIGGAFLKPNKVKSLSIGQEILLTILYPDSKRNVRVIGEIVRIESKGVGIKFKKESLIR